MFPRLQKYLAFQKCWTNDTVTATVDANFEELINCHFYQSIEALKIGYKMKRLIYCYELLIVNEVSKYFLQVVKEVNREDFTVVDKVV